jgi:hypothetical protein
MPTADFPSADYDSLFFYLSRLQHGDWSHFTQAVKGIGLEDNVFGLAHRLFLLSHIDWNMHGNKYWNAAPPTFVQTKEDEWVWTGYRALAALDLLARYYQNELSIVYEPQFKSPTAIFLHTPDAALVSRVAAKLNAQVMGQDTGKRFLANLHPIRDIQPTPISMIHPYGKVELYDPFNLRWRLVVEDEELDRCDFGLVRYGHYFDRNFAIVEKGRYKKVNGGIGQYYLFNQLRYKVLRYSPEKREIAAPFTAELPYLYGRAVLLESGRMPHKRGDWFVYQNISQITAELLAQCLGQSLEIEYV